MRFSGRAPRQQAPFNERHHTVDDEHEHGEQRERRRQHGKAYLSPASFAQMTSDKVGPGMMVTIRPLDEDDPDEETYLLASHAEERAPHARTVTTTSPLGRALMGAALEQEIVYEAPGGSFRYVVVKFAPRTG
jgi:transcription elongation GreA/GreB family factor